MAQASSGDLSISDEWLLDNVPFISFFSDDGSLEALRFFKRGASLEALKESPGIEPVEEDREILEAQIEQSIKGNTPVVSRCRVIGADGKPTFILLISKAVLDHGRHLVGLAGTAVGLADLPDLQGEPGLLSEPAEPAKRRPVGDQYAEIDPRWVASELPILTFFTENDANYTVRHMSGSLEELLGYSAEEFLDATVYKPASTVYPEDQDIADAYIEEAAKTEAGFSAARFRIVNAGGETVPVLIFARGALPKGLDRPGVAGGVLDISHVPTLQGPFRLLRYRKS